MQLLLDLASARLRLRKRTARRTKPTTTAPSRPTAARLAISTVESDEADELPEARAAAAAAPMLGLAAAVPVAATALPVRATPLAARNARVPSLCRVLVPLVAAESPDMGRKDRGAPDAYTGMLLAPEPSDEESAAVE